MKTRNNIQASHQVENLNDHNPTVSWGILPYHDISLLAPVAWGYPFFNGVTFG